MSVATDQLLDVVTRFVDEEAMPAVAAYDRDDAYPEPLVERMCELGLFGTAIPREHGGLGLDLLTYAKVVAEISRAWISLSGVMNTHFMAAWMLQRFGTAEQQERLLPPMATGELRGAFSITEPHAASDVQAIRVRAVRDGDAYVVDGQKKWITNGLRAGVIMLLAVTDPDAQPRHRGFTCLVAEKEPLVLDAAQRKQAGERADLQAGMAKLFATETAEECALDAMRIYGGAAAHPRRGLQRDPAPHHRPAAPGGAGLDGIDRLGETVVVAARPGGIAVRRPADRRGRVGVDGASEVVVEPVERESLDRPRDAGHHGR